MFIIQNKQETQKKTAKNNQKYLKSFIKGVLGLAALKALGIYFRPAISTVWTKSIDRSIDDRIEMRAELSFSDWLGRANGSETQAFLPNARFVLYWSNPIMLIDYLYSRP